EESGAFTVVDVARQPSTKIPQRPNLPQRPKEPAADAGENVKTKYQTDLAKYEIALKKYETDVAAFDATKAKAAQTDFDAALKERMDKLSPENLKKYDAIIFANTTGVLPLSDK